MRLGHMSDCHLGFRQGYRSTEHGLNQREADVARAFRATVDGILAQKVDMVCIAGDLFHTVRPTNAAITFAFRQLRRLRDAGLPVVLVAGNHDCPKTAESGSILHLLSELGIDLAIDEVRQFDYPALGLTVTAVPDRTEVEGVSPGQARFNVLLAHGMVEGTCPHILSTLPLSMIEDERWDYCALGDYHIRKEITPRAWYSGSLEFTSTNIWQETGTPKGWLLVDLDGGTVEPQLVPTRTVLDLEPFDATGMDAAEVNRELAARLSDVSGKIVRARVFNIPTAVRRQLDHKQIKRWMTDALLLKLDFIRPESVERERQGRPRQTLDELVGEFFARRVLPPGMDREAFVAAGQELMAEDREEQLERGAA